MRDTTGSARTHRTESTIPVRRDSAEISRLGDDIYEREIRPRVEPDHHGQVVAIDVDSGSWAIGENVIIARDRLRSQRPSAVDVWLVRVGQRALHHFGGRPLRRAR